MFSGDQNRGAVSPVPLKKDVENMEKGNAWIRVAVDSKIRLRLCPNRSASLGSPAEELQKVLLEQIDFRRRLEQEFHALKGTSPFPVFRELFYWCFLTTSPSPSAFNLWPKLQFFFSCSDNFQDQMKRELAYREEMVQQLQMVRRNSQSQSFDVFRASHSSSLHPTCLKTKTIGTKFKQEHERTES